MRMEHENLTVANVDRSVDFYGTLLGYRLRWKGTSSDGAPAAHVGDDGQYIAFFQAEKPGRVDPDYAKVGMNHVGFVVDDLGVMKARLGALGIEPTQEMNYEPGRRVYFLDPDGIEVELVEYDR